MATWIGAVVGLGSAWWLIECGGGVVVDQCGLIDWCGGGVVVDRCRLVGLVVVW